MMRDLATTEDTEDTEALTGRRLHKRIGDQEPLLTSCPLVQIQRACFFSVYSVHILASVSSAFSVVES